MSVTREEFIVRVEQIAAEEPSYRLGGSGDDGTCDCIGLIIGAVRRAGGSWSGTHGSNYAARSETDGLTPITGSQQLQPGDVVYKARSPGDSGYALPDKYKSGTDLRDYYHVGIVVGNNPLRIRHMTTPRPKMDTTLGKWSYFGRLKKVSYDGGQTETMEKVWIYGGNSGSPINMRAGSSTSSKIVAEIPQKSEAELISGGVTWSKIRWAGREGYVMTKFVVRESGNSGGSDAGATVTVSRAELEKAYDILGGLLGLRG